MVARPRQGRSRRADWVWVLAVSAACAAGASTVTACSGSGTPAGTAARTHPRSYYLALGDSLARGVQPNAAGVSVPTRQGDPHQLYAVLHRAAPGLRLVKLGCPGETTGTMIHGGICSYPAGSQLAAAVSFLRAHRGQVSLITIDIGANDPNSCITGIPLGKIASCLGERFTATLANLATILRQLRAAGGRKVTITGMSYYVPELSAWLTGKAGEVIAVVIERVAAAFNQLEARVYQRFQARVANVFGAFHSDDFADHVRLAGFGTVPRNVATICAWTWICASAPRGPNQHANTIGYGVIAQAFLQADRR